MKELYDITASEAINSIADTVSMHFGVKKSLAKKAVINALIYNCVVDEIVGQAAFLLGESDSGDLE